MTCHLLSMSKSSSNCTAGTKGVKKMTSCEIVYLKLCPMSMSKSHKLVTVIHAPSFDLLTLSSEATSRYFRFVPSFLDAGSSELCQRMECLLSVFGLCVFTGS